MTSDYAKNISRLEAKYRTKKRLNAEESDKILLNECPRCSYGKLCKYFSAIHSRLYKMCIIRSCDSEYVMVNYDKHEPKVKIGQQYGFLTVLENSYKNKHNQMMWLCRCSCGEETIVAGYALSSGNTKCCKFKRRHQI